MHLSIERRMQLGFSLVFSLTLFITGASLQISARQKELNHWVTHSQQVQTQIQHVLALVTKAKAGERGFILTGDIHFIDSHTDEFSDIEPELSSLNNLVADSPAQQTNLARLRFRVGACMHVVEQVIRLRKQGQIQAAYNIASSHQARTTMESMEQAIGAMKQEESILLQRRTEAMETYQQNTKRLFVCLLPLILASLVLVYFGVRATYRQTITTLESISDAFFALDPTWRFTYVNGQAEVLLKQKRADLLGKSMWTMFPGVEETALGQQYRRTMEEKTTQRFEAFYAPLAQWLEITAYVSDDGLSVYLHDITGRKRVEEHLERVNAQLEKQMLLVKGQTRTLQAQKAELEDANQQLTALAITDGLTGLNNHRAFQNKVAEEFKRTQRYNTPLSIILLDVDKFKTYNDAFGHPEGDIVLKRVAQALQMVARDTDYVCRYGGEEFVVILTNTEAAGAIEAAERFRTTIATQPWNLRPVTASFGISTLCADLTTPQELIDQADKALYSSKRQGRNRVTHFANISLAADWEEPEETTSLPYSDEVQEIPLPERLFAVIDVYDALTTDRPDGRAWSKQQTLANLHSLTGTHFGSDAINEFLAMLSQDG